MFVEPLRKQAGDFSNIIRLLKVKSTSKQKNTKPGQRATVRLHLHSCIKENTTLRP